MPRALASASNGTISGSNYAWGENVGWINFGAPTGDVHITDTGLSGYAWSGQYGWINLAPGGSFGSVTNTAEGQLGGTAWSSHLGAISFSGVTITAAGRFTGTAGTVGSPAGRISFDCASCAVLTDWRPASARSSTGGSGSGGGGGGGNPLQTSTVNQPMISETTSETNNANTVTLTFSAGPEVVGMALGNTPNLSDSPGIEPFTTTLLWHVCTDSDSCGQYIYAKFYSANGSSSDIQKYPIGKTIHAAVPLSTLPAMDSTEAEAENSTAGNGKESGIGTLPWEQVLPKEPAGCQGLVPSSGALGIVASRLKDSHCGAITIIASVVQRARILSSLTALAATVLFFTPASLTATEIVLLPSHLWMLLLMAFGLRKRRTHWGTVYDSATKQPLALARVTLRTSEGLEILSSVTDDNGHFGLVVTEPGMYAISVEEMNYQFPSQQLVGNGHAGTYRDLYFGEYFTVSNSSLGKIIVKNIPLDHINFNWNIETRTQQHRVQSQATRARFLRTFFDILFGFGFFLAALSIMFEMTLRTGVIFILYTILFFVRTRGAYGKPLGTVLDFKTKEPMPLAILRISSATTGLEVLHRLTDTTGHYSAELPNGDYRVRIDRKLPDGSYGMVALDLPVRVTRGFLGKNFSV